MVRAALDEDFRYGAGRDVGGDRGRATVTADVVARETGVVAGLPVALAVLDLLGDYLRAAGPGAAAGRRRGTALVADGAGSAAGDAVLRVSGDAVAVLGAERTMLNFLTHLSGIASATRNWADAVAGTGAVIRDTRKTLPGLRGLEKYAVRCGGGENHRMGLGDAALVKDNHVAAAGGITAAVRAVRAAARPGLVIEVECDSVAQVREALAAGARFILLDNMPVPGAARGGGGGARLRRGAARGQRRAAPGERARGRRDRRRLPVGGRAHPLRRGCLTWGSTTGRADRGEPARARGRSRAATTTRGGGTWAG